MTAEIAILNKEAVALAADSAVTVMFSSANSEPSHKIFSSANKLFALSKYAPVGMMIYGNATFMGVPWETLIKEYRRKLDTDIFHDLKGYAQDFIKFLDGGNKFIPSSVQDEAFRDEVVSFYEYIRERIIKKYNEYLVDHKTISRKKAVEIAKSVINRDNVKFEKADSLKSLPKTFGDRLKKRYKKDIEDAIRNVFEKMPVEKDKLRKFALWLFTKQRKEFTLPRSGIVISGFGDKDIYPSIYSFRIDGFVTDRLIYAGELSQKISFQSSALIVPFAQHEMVVTFMEGIDPNYSMIVNGNLKTLLQGFTTEYTKAILDQCIKDTADRNKIADKLLEKSGQISSKLYGVFKKILDEYRDSRFSRPVLGAVSSLPKDELASMAESLINLTSFKRRVSLVQETVGGPIDVAVISKSDGFVWIKRKRYFDKDLNPRFFANYSKKQ